MKDYVELASRTRKHPGSIFLTMQDNSAMHAALGVAGEAGELVDAIKKSVIYGKPYDVVNIVEEVGDIFWYIAILCDTFGFTFEEAMEKNITKLRLRYPDKYTDEHALKRADKE